MSNIFEAARTGDAASVAAFIAPTSGGDVGSAIRAQGTSTGWSAAHLAASHGHCDVVRLLIDRAGRSQIVALDFSLNTPLHCAVSNATSTVHGFDTVRLLLEHCNVEDVNAKNVHGKTPLHLSVALQSQELSEILLRAGACPQQDDQNRQTPIQLARSKGDRGMMALLNKYINSNSAAKTARAIAEHDAASAHPALVPPGARLAPVPPAAATALVAARPSSGEGARSSPAPRAARTLAAATAIGSTASESTNELLSWLFIAIRAENTAMVSTLLSEHERLVVASEKYEQKTAMRRITSASSSSAGAAEDGVGAVEHTDDVEEHSDGNVALHVAAASSGCGAMIQLLVREFHAPIDFGNAEGATPLHVACRAEKSAAARALIALGANVNAVDKFGRTALHYCVLHAPPAFEIARMLLAHAASPEIRDKVQHKSPMDYARAKKGAGRLLALLQSRAGPPSRGGVATPRRAVTHAHHHHHHPAAAAEHRGGGLDDLLDSQAEEADGGDGSSPTQQRQSSPSSTRRSLEELESTSDKLTHTNAELRREVVALRNENARLRGQENESLRNEVAEMRIERAGRATRMLAMAEEGEELRRRVAELEEQVRKMTSIGRASAEE